MKKFNKFIKIGIEAAKNNHSKFKLAAVAVNKYGRVLSVGVNSCKTHPKQARLAKIYGHEDQIGLHSELAAIVKCREQIYTLVVVRLLQNNTLAMARPCRICNEAIRLAGIKNVVYSNIYGMFTWEKR